MSKAIDKKNLICPKCYSNKLLFKKKIIYCLTCSRQYKINNNKYYFNDYKKFALRNSLDKIKYLFKKYGKLYELLIWLISPVCPSSNLNHFIRKYIHRKNIIALNIGSGNSNLSNNISNIDIIDYNNVDLVCDIHHLPFNNNTIDVIINIAVLEHINNPKKVIKEIHRVLKPQGYIFSFVPFMQGYHASPHDFFRFTHEGIKLLYKDFQIIEIKNAGGPTSGILWLLQEWIALILSFGIKPLHNVLLIVIMICTFPIKFLDIFLKYFPFSKNISSGFFYIGKKI